MTAESFIGEVRSFAGNFAPRGWAFCDGQLLPIAQNTALFSLLGTTYGGDGRSTFALPNLQGRAPMHPGRGPGLTSRRLGERGGSSTITLSVNHLPPHNHTIPISQNLGNVTSPANAYIGGEGIIDRDFANTSDGTHMHANMIQDSGGGQSFNIYKPFLGINFIIALVGTYPSRS